MPVVIDDAVSVRGQTGMGARARAGDESLERPILLLLHGYGSNEQDLPGLAAYLPDGFDVVSPRAPLTLGHGSYAWFPIALPGRPDRAGVLAASAALRAWITERLPAGRTIVALGFSQGGLMVSQLLREDPELLSAGVVLSGFALDGVQAGDAALAALRPPVFFGHGDADQIIPAVATGFTSAWLADHTALTDKSYPGLPHSVSAEELADVAQFLHEAVLAR